MTGNVKQKRNSWSRGNGSYSYRGELKEGIRLEKNYYNRKVRRCNKGILNGSSYKKVTHSNVRVKLT